MLTETISGKCPCCGYDKMVQRYGSIGYFQMDACPNCGFAYGTNHYDGEHFGEEVGIGYFKHLLDCWSIEYQEKESNESIRRKVFDKLEQEERCDDVEGTIFSYDEKDIQKHKEFKLVVFKQ